MSEGTRLNRVDAMEIDVGVYHGVDRRSSKNISREEFNHHAINAREWRAVVDRRLSDGDIKLEKITTALFAPDDKNDNGQRGLMPTAKAMDAHITAVCKIAGWIRTGLLTIFGLIVAGAGAAKALGLM